MRLLKAVELDALTLGSIKGLHQRRLIHLGSKLRASELVELIGKTIGWLYIWEIDDGRRVATGRADLRCNTVTKFFYLLSNVISNFEKTN
jgi:hypothetical protein